MALHNTWGDFNKRTDDGLDVRYVCENVNWEGDSNHAPRYHYSRISRICTKSYSYIGMDLQTAMRCRDVKRRQYSRLYAMWTVTLRDMGGIAPYAWINQIFNFNCLASVQLQHVAGDNWSVVIQVNETDVTIARSPQNDLDALERLFEFANIRDYDEDIRKGGVYVFSAACDEAEGTIEIDFSIYAEHFDRTRLVPQKKSGNSWSAFTDYDVFDGKIVVRSSPVESSIRLVYDSSLYSNEVEPSVTRVDITITDVTTSSVGRKVLFTTTIPDFNPDNLSLFRWDCSSIGPEPFDGWVLVDSVGQADGILTPAQDGRFKIVYVDANGETHVSAPFAHSNIVFTDMTTLYVNADGNLRARYVHGQSAAPYAPYAIMPDGSFAAATVIDSASGEIVFGKVEGASVYFILDNYSNNSNTRSVKEDPQ